MRAVVQLVSKASVQINERIISSINEGLLVLLGIHKEDSAKDAAYLAEKIVTLRIFPDENKLMNRSLLDTKGELLVVSQFTLFGDCRKGRRPSYSHAASPEKGKELYNVFIDELNKNGIPVSTGEFQAMMNVSLVNKGPVTVLLDSAKQF